MLVSLPALVLLAAVGAGWLLRNTRFRSAVVAAAALVLIADLVIRREYYDRPRKPQIREALAYVAANNPDNSAIMIVSDGNESQREMIDYMFATAGSSLRTTGLGGHRNTEAEFYAILAEQKPEYVWLVQFQASIGPSQNQLKRINTNLDLVSRKRWNGAQVWLFKNPAFETVDDASPAAAP
jgi:hypothetical protein